MNYRRRAPLQLASTLGFVLNRTNGKFLGLTPAETNAVHECLSWGRQGNNNRILQFFGTNYEAFTAACVKLKEKIDSVVPQGNRRARIRAINRESRVTQTGELGDTLGDEVSGMVVVDVGGHPLKYDCLKVLESIVLWRSRTAGWKSMYPGKKDVGGERQTLRSTRKSWKISVGKI